MGMTTLAALTQLDEAHLGNHGNDIAPRNCSRPGKI